VRNIDTYGPCLIIIKEYFEFEMLFGVVHAYLNIIGPASPAQNPFITLNVEIIQNLRFRKSYE
jgi:hypothetical protein